MYSSPAQTRLRHGRHWLTLPRTAGGTTAVMQLQDQIFGLIKSINTGKVAAFVCKHGAAALDFQQLVRMWHESELEFDQHYGKQYIVRKLAEMGIFPADINKALVRARL